MRDLPLCARGVRWETQRLVVAFVVRLHPPGPDHVTTPATPRRGSSSFLHRLRSPQMMSADAGVRSAPTTLEVFAASGVLMPQPAPATTLPRPLLVTAHPRLRDDLLGLCATAGVEPEVVADVVAARSLWADAPLVLVGSDLARDAAQAGLQRRTAVVLVGLDLDDAGVWDVAVVLGADSVVFLPDARAWLVDRIADAVEEHSRGHVVAVIGGRGGAGATTLASALAMTAANQRLRCMLIDGDPLGGGIDLALGGEGTAGLRWAELAGAGNRVSSSALWAALPEVSRLAVLSYERRKSGPVPAEAMGAVLRAGRRVTDLVVVDLARHVDATAEVVVTDADVTLLVVPAEVRAAAAGARVASALAPLACDLRVVVRGPSPGGLDGAAVAHALGLPLAGWLDAEPGLAQAAERGEPPARRAKGPLSHFCRELLAELPLPGRSAA